MSAFSTINSKITLDWLQHETEGQYFERKGREVKPSKLANEIIGMLNASGGVIALGVGNGGQIDDLSYLETNQLDKFRRVLFDYIEPPANIQLEERELSSGELIFLYHVEQDYERLFKRKDNEEVYLRVTDQNKGPLSLDEIRMLEYNKPIRSFEDEVQPDFTSEHLKRQTCEDYREAMNYEGSFDELLIARNLATHQGADLKYKKAAVLLFGENPSVFIPSALVRYARYAGEESKTGRDYNVVKDERFEGNIPHLIRELDTFLEGALRDYYFLNVEQGKFQRIPEYPKEAWLEGIVNALCHRSYNLHGNTIYIHHYDDRLVITNSGPLPAQVTVENIRSERYSRNPRIARALSDLGYVRELNEGVRRIFEVMRASMLSEPEYENRNETVTLTLRNKVASHRATIHSDVLQRIENRWQILNESQKNIVHSLFQKISADIATLATLTNLSEGAVRYNLKLLAEEQLVFRDSDKIRDKNAPYRFPDA